MGLPGARGPPGLPGDVGPPGIVPWHNLIMGAHIINCNVIERIYEILPDVFAYFFLLALK